MESRDPRKNHPAILPPQRAPRRAEGRGAGVNGTLNGRAPPRTGRETGRKGGKERRDSSCVPWVELSGEQCARQIATDNYRRAWDIDVRRADFSQVCDGRGNGKGVVRESPGSMRLSNERTSRNLLSVVNQGAECGIPCNAASYLANWQIAPFLTYSYSYFSHSLFQ